MSKPVKLCNRCKAADNPLGNLQFVKSPEGCLCVPCNARIYASKNSTPFPLSAASDLTVIRCPDCLGNSPGPHGTKCLACNGYGVVKVAMSDIKFYSKVEVTDDDS